MFTRNPRTPNGTAVVFGAAVFVTLMLGVGGYQASAADLLGDVLPRVADADQPSVRSGGSALSMCPRSGQSDSGFSSMGTSTPLSLGSVCD